jgi:hypothetical protein
MRDVMVDLETLGTVPGFVILSIGAVAFDEQGLHSQEFYSVIHRPSCEEAFLTVCPRTEKWWEDKEPEAREVLEQSLELTMSQPLKAVLERFNFYLGRFGGRQNVRLWGNGSDFDNAGLACAYDAVEAQPGWSFWNNRCYRTLKNLAPEVEMEREGTYHNALDDARSQARHLLRILEARGLTLS